jgi:hypothetical protein
MATFIFSGTRKVVIDLLRKNTVLVFKRSNFLSAETSEINLFGYFRALPVRQFGWSHALCGEIDFCDAGRFMLLFDFALTADLR